jgi:uncharacterized membrane protein YbhN (UPF0104 family)
MGGELTRQRQHAGTMDVMTDTDSNRRPRRAGRLLLLVVAVLVIVLAALACWVLGELVGRHVASIVVVGVAVIGGALGRRRGGRR